MQISVKRMLAIVLSVAMLVSCMVFSFGASADVVLQWHNDFNTVTATNWSSAYPTSGGGDNTVTAGVRSALYDATAGVNGTGAMVLSMTNTKNAAGFRIYSQDNTDSNHGGETSWNSTKAAQGKFKTVNQSMYIVELDYKVVSTSANMNIWVAIGAINHTYENQLITGTTAGKSEYKRAALITADDARIGTWQHAVVAFGALDTQGVHIQIADTNAITAEVVIDNVEIKEYTAADTQHTVSYVCNGETVATSAAGYATTQVETPDLSAVVPDGYSPEIYSDAALTQKLDVVRYGTTDTTVYVKLPAIDGIEEVSRAWSFESEKANANISAHTSRSAVIIVDADKAYTGNNSLQVTLDDRTGATRPQFYIKDADGQNVSVEKGKGYIITYYVRESDEGTNGTLHLNTWFHAGDGTSTRGTSTTSLLDDGGADTKEMNSSAGWVKITKYIPSAAASGQLLFGITDNSCSASSADVIYVDDITVTCVDDIKFNAGNNDRMQELYAEQLTGGNWTNLHKHTTNKTDDGVYTSMRLGATYASADETGATVYIGGVAYDIAARGIVVGTADMSLTADGTQGTDYKWKSAKTSDFGNAWEKDGNNITYTLRLANMNESWFTSDTQYRFRSYYVINVPYIEEASNTVNNLQFTVYGTTSAAFTFGGLAEDILKANADKRFWFDDYANVQS